MLALVRRPNGGSSVRSGRERIEVTFVRQNTVSSMREGGRRAAVFLVGLLSRLGRRANGSPPRQLLCGVSPPADEMSLCPRL